MLTRPIRQIHATSGIERRRLLGALVGVVFAWLAVASFAATANAQPSDAQVAQQRFEAGTHAFEDGDYALAIQEFQAAYDLTQHPDLLFNIYSAAERAGRLEEAERALAMYLELGRPGRQRRALTNRLARLRTRLAEMRDAQPPPPAVEPEPPVAVVAEVATPEPTPPLDPPPPTPPSGLQVHPAAIGTLVGAAVLFASFGLFAGLSEAEDQSLASRCGRDAGAVCSPDDVRALETYNVLADVSWIAGAAVAVTGLVLLFALPPEQATEQPPSVAVTPWVTPYAAGASAVGRW